MKYTLLTFCVLCVCVSAAEAVTNVTVEADGIWAFLKWLGTTYGGVAIVLGWQEYRNKSREERMGKRLDEVQDAHTKQLSQLTADFLAQQQRNAEVLLTALRDNSAALAQNAEANRASNDASSKTTNAILQFSGTIESLKAVLQAKQ